MTTTIRLAASWTIGLQIGSGGFGRVFEATGEDGQLAAAKLIPKEPGANRELLFENLVGVRSVVPIIDSGECADDWVLIMPRASKSLRDHLVEHRVLPPQEAVSILRDIAEALADLQGRVVHRDIKPENVLLLDDHWCLSDFGIARYAEASTAADTHKWAWTPSYSAPERWRSERATAASDVYSFGIMAYEILSGHLPFSGPDFRNQHLHNEAMPLAGCPALFSALVTECMFKAADVRPMAANVLARLGVILRAPTPGASHLQAANDAEVRRLAAHAVQQSAARSSAEWRHDVVDSATKALAIIVERLAQEIRENAPAAIWQATRRSGILGSSVILGNATLTIGSVQQAAENPWSHWKPKLQVVAHASIDVRVPPDRFQYEGRGHSLWFCDAQEPGVFRWFETAFMVSPLLPQRMAQDPFALPPGEESGKALSNGMTQFQVAWPFTVIEPGNDTNFLERWITWFAAAAQGRLGHPSSMPEENPEGSWRR